MYARTAVPWSTWTGSTGTTACCALISRSPRVGSGMQPTVDDSVAKCNYVDMDVRDFPRDSCAVGAALTPLGDRWTLLVLREAFFGVRRFEELRRNTGAAKNILADRLRRLRRARILPARPY